MKYESVIGLEIHLQLKTNTKVFCSCSTDYVESKENTHLCPVCLGHPGALPKLNLKVVKYAVLGGLALNCKINNISSFDRKNYFYPDTPKAYQITQFEKTYASNGHIEIPISKEQTKTITIREIHIEEDAGKNIHTNKESYINFNRSSIPLIEIVTNPDIQNSKEAYNFLQNLKSILKYTGISDVNMENGSLRCDANVSVREFGKKELGTRTETKNLNSFKAVASAIDYEISRQIDLIEDGKEVIQETRLWDENDAVTRSMRAKGGATDYRYFPEPDLPNLIISDEYIEEIRKLLPEFALEKRIRFIHEYNIPEYDATIISQNIELANYFENVVKISKNAKITSSWILTEILKYLKDKKIEIINFPISIQNFGDLISMISSNEISGKIGKKVFEIMLNDSKRNPKEIVKTEGLIQITNSNELEGIVIKIIEANEQSVIDYKAGKDRAFKYLMGQIMKETKGKANPKLVNKILKEKLERNYDKN